MSEAQLIALYRQRAGREWAGFEAEFRSRAAMAARLAKEPRRPRLERARARTELLGHLLEREEQQK